MTSRIRSYSLISPFAYEGAIFFLRDSVKKHSFIHDSLRLNAISTMGCSFMHLFIAIMNGVSDWRQISVERKKRKCLSNLCRQVATMMIVHFSFTKASERVGGYARESSQQRIRNPGKHANAWALGKMPLITLRVHFTKHLSVGTTG